MDESLDTLERAAYNYGPDELPAYGINSTELPAYARYDDDSFRVAIDYMFIYLTPVVITIGVTTNILSFMVFVFTHMRLQSSSIYLASLAVSDSTFLVATFFSWLSWIRINVVHETYLCHVVVYLTYISSFISVWTVLSFTVERYIVVCHPFQRQRMCTVRRAKIVVTCEAVFALLFYSYALWTTKLVDQGGYTVCYQDEKYITFTRYISYVDSITTLIIPSVAIILLNARITIAIYQFLKNRWTLNIRVEESNVSSRTTSLRLSRSHATMENGARRPRRLPAQYQSNRKSTVQTHVESPQSNSPHMKTTRMLLIVSAVFVTLNLPGHVLRIHQVIAVDFLDRAPSETEKRWAELFELIYYVNFSTNFFLYTMCTRSFREATRRLCSRVWHFTKNLVPSCLRFFSGGCKREQKDETLPELRELNFRRETLNHSLNRSRPGSRNTVDKIDNINTL